MVPAAAPAAAGRAGRKRVTSREELEHVEYDPFNRRGFERTTIGDTAAAAGIGRRTFFRYFPSKNDVAWGSFDEELERMRLRLKAFPPELSLMDAVRVAAEAAAGAVAGVIHAHARARWTGRTLRVEI